MDGRSINFSVIVATRNRAESLKDTLSKLASQETEGRFTYEVVVVDNGSSDSTRQVVETFAAGFPVAVRYLREDRLGKPYALNTGMAHACGEIFAITDDDVMPTPGWLKGLWSCFQEEKAEAVGGKILPLWVDGRPDWLTDELLHHVGGSLGLVDRGDRRLFQGCQWVGGNLAIRREVVARVGGFDIRLLRSQDTEYYQRCRRTGIRVVYEPGAVVRHKVGPERLTLKYLRIWRHRTGYYHAYLPPWRKYHLLTVLPLYWYRVLIDNAFRWVGSFVARRPWRERFIYELWLRNSFSQWLHRFQLLPRWWVAVLQRRSQI